MGRVTLRMKLQLESARKEESVFQDKGPKFAIGPEWASFMAPTEKLVGQRGVNTKEKGRRYGGKGQ